MTISIKHASGGSIVDLANLFHEDAVEFYRRKFGYDKVQVTTKRKSRTTLAVLLKARLVQLDAQRIARERAAYRAAIAAANR